MKVNGQLEVAQLEQIASAGPSPSPTGRIYMNITNPSNAIPTYYNGTAWVPMAVGQSATPVSQNSGLSCIVNWANGLNQKVTLTANCVISLQNPVPGQVHTLSILQPNSATVFMYQLDMADQETRRGRYQPIGVLPPNSMACYQWLYSFNERASISIMPTTMTAPQSAPPTLITGMDISPDMKTLTYGRTSSPFNATYDVTENYYGAVSSLGIQNIGTPATLAAQPAGISYGPDGKSIFIASATSPFLQGYLTSRGTANQVLSNPVTLPAGAAKCVAVHPTGYFVGVGHSTTPFMSNYPYLGGSFGTKLTDPVSLPAAAVTGLAWSLQGDYLTAVSQTTPFIQTWVFTQAGSTGTIGTVSANPGTLPTGGPAGSLGRAVAWRPQGDYIAMANTTSPFLYVVPFNRTTGAYGTALTVSVLPAGASNCVAWSPDGQFLYVGTGTTPFLEVYDFSNFSLASKIVLTANPGQVVNEIVVHPNGETIYCGLNAGVFIVSYQAPTKFRSYIRLIGP